VKALLALFEHPTGVDPGPGNRMAYDIAADRAHFGSCSIKGPALLWELTPVGSHGDQERPAGGAVLRTVVTLDDSHDWLMRCDRVDFPPGAVADWHTHPGPGIRRLLFGELTVTTGGVATAHQAGGSWFESGPEPVYAVSSATHESAFVRVLLLPTEWAGRRTIRYINPGRADRKVNQRARVLREEPLS